ncbi:unnamed protein product, partial [Didymodactylos carnosus]
TDEGYISGQMKQIDEYERDYHSDQAIEWY